MRIGWAKSNIWEILQEKNQSLQQISCKRKKKKKRQKGIRKPIDFNKSLKRHCGDLIWIVIWRNSKKKTKEILGNLRLVGRFVYFLSIRYGSCF